jgi:hypothetical protein
MAMDPTLPISNCMPPIPQLAFGLYKVPANEEGEAIILDAVKVRDLKIHNILVANLSLCSHRYIRTNQTT